MKLEHWLRYVSWYFDEKLLFCQTCHLPLSLLRHATILIEGHAVGYVLWKHNLPISLQRHIQYQIRPCYRTTQITHRVVTMVLVIDKEMVVYIWIKNNVLISMMQFISSIFHDHDGAHLMWSLWLNSLAPGRYQRNFRYLISQII